MEPTFILEPTKSTPFVKIDYKEKYLEIIGRSVPEHSLEFYQPVFDKIGDFLKTGGKSFTANFKMLYFNTSSARCIFLIIKELKKLEENGIEVEINWFADKNDDDMRETGEDYQAIVDMNFNIRTVYEV